MKHVLTRVFARRAASNLKKVRQKKPLIHNITNYVVMNYTANALLACGASPVMAHAAEEVEEMVSLADALVLNIGTLTPQWVEAMLRAGKKANALGCPLFSIRWVRRHPVANRLCPAPRPRALPSRW